VIVDTAVQEKAITHPVDSRLLDIARHKVVSATKRAGIGLEQTFAKERMELRRWAGGYAHAKRFRRLEEGHQAPAHDSGRRHARGATQEQSGGLRA
jgi:IS5 family transposase